MDKGAKIGVILAGLVLVPATALGQNQTTTSEEDQLYRKVRDHFMSIPGVIGFKIEETKITVFVENESVKDRLPSEFEGRRVVAEVMEPPVAEDPVIIGETCPEVAKPPVFKTDKETYQVGEPIIVSGDVWTAGDQGSEEEINFRLDSDRDEEFGGFDEGAVFVKTEPGECGFTFEFNLIEEMSDLHPGNWTLSISHWTGSAYLKFEVIEENLIIVPGPEDEQEGNKITLPGSESIKLIGSNIANCEEPVKKAFERLHTPKAKEYYEFVVEWLTTIECTSEDEKEWGFGWYDGRPKTIALASYTFDGDNNEWGWNMDGGFIAGVIVHESFHVYQFQSGRDLPDIDIEAEAGLYQTKAEFAMNHSNFPWMTALEYCHYRIESLYSTYSLGEDTDEIHIDYCGEPARVSEATAQDAVVDNSTGLNVLIPDSNITNVEDPIVIPSVESESEKEEEQQSNSTSTTTTNWFIELWRWIRGMINSMLSGRS